MVEKSELSRNVPDWWSQMFAPVRQFGERIAEFFAPSSEAAATEDAYEITVELPGVSDADIHAEVRAPDGRVGRALRRVRIEWGADACAPH